MSDPRVDLAFNGSVATITLRRPEKLNALDLAMIAALQHAVVDIEAHVDVRCAVIMGEGKVFCAGGDIAAWGGLAPIEMWRNWTRAGHRAFDGLARLRVPLIAVLSGDALGGGLELAATADLIIAERQVRLGLPETGLGMIPGWSGTQRLVRRFGSRVIKRLALTGQIVGADEAMALQMVDEVVEAGAGRAAGVALAQKICSRGPIAVQVAKQLVNAAEGEEQALAYEALAGALTAYTDDLGEGVAAYKAKRQPNFGNS